MLLLTQGLVAILPRQWTKSVMITARQSSHAKAMGVKDILQAEIHEKGQAKGSSWPDSYPITVKRLSATDRCYVFQKIMAVSTWFAMCGSTITYRYSLK